MKKVLYGMTMVMSLMWVTNVQAQENGSGLTRAEKKVLEEKLDSLQFEESRQAINEKAFTLEADQVIFKYGQMVYVNSNTNFVSVEKDRAVVQVAFNVPVSGPNGLGGVTVEGIISSYEVKEDKKGNLRLVMNVTGTGISARVEITLAKGSGNAMVEIQPNFNSNRLRLRGVVLPLYKSNVFKGRSI